MRIPETTECFRLMEHYGMLPNIKNHSVIVARVAELLVDGLRKHEVVAQQAPSRELVIAGALLHDIAKTPCLRDGCDHAQLGAQICGEHGYPEIAGIIAEHVTLHSHDPRRYQAGHFTARDLVYYADKRVMHEEVVSLEIRLDYILGHYGRNDARVQGLIRDNFAQCRTLERHLFSFLSFSPAALREQVISTLSGTFSV